MLALLVRQEANANADVRTALTRAEAAVVVVQHHTSGVEARVVPEVFDGHVVDVGDGVLTAEVVAAQAYLTVPAHVQFPEREGTALVVERIVEGERRAAVVGQTPRHLVGIVLGDGRQQANTASLLGVVVRNARFQRDDVVLIDIDLLDEIPVAV